MTSRNEVVYFPGCCRELLTLTTWMLILFLAGLAVGQQSSTPDLGPLSTEAVTSEPQNISDTSQVMVSAPPEGKYDRVLPASAVTMPTKLSTNQHASCMGTCILHPSSTLLAVLSSKHFIPSYMNLYSDWLYSTRVASISYLHELLGLGSISEPISHDSTQQLALKMAFSSLFKTDIRIETLQPANYSVIARLACLPQNCLIRTTVANLYQSNKPVTSQIDTYIYSTLHSDIATIKSTPFHEYSSSGYINNIMHKEKKISPATEPLTNQSLQSTTESNPDFSLGSVSFTDLLIKDNPQLCRVNASPASIPDFHAFPNPISAPVFVLVDAKSITLSTNLSLHGSVRFSKFTNNPPKLLLTNNSLAHASSTHPYSNSFSREVYVTSLYSTHTLLIDQLHRSASFTGENRCALGDIITSLQSVPVRRVMMMTLGPLLPIIAASITNPDQGLSITVTIATPALLHVASHSQGSGLDRLSSVTTLQFILTLDLSVPTSVGHPTVLSGQMLPLILRSSPYRLLILQMRKDPVSLILRSHQQFDLLSNSNSGSFLTLFPVLISSFERCLSLPITTGYSSLPHLKSSPSLELLTVEGSADKTVQFICESRLESNLRANFIQSLFCITKHEASSLLDSVQTHSPNLSKLSCAALESRTVQCMIDPTPDTQIMTRTRSLHLVTQGQQMINHHLLVFSVHGILLGTKSRKRLSLAKSLTPSPFTAPSFATSCSSPPVPSDMSRSGQLGLLFESPNPIQTFRHPISVPSDLSVFNQSPWYYLPGTVSMAAAVQDTWEIVHSASCVLSNYESLTDANQLYNRALKEMKISNVMQNHLYSFFAPFTSFSTPLVYFFLLIYFLNVISTSVFSSLSSSSMHFSSLCFLFLSYLFLPFLSFPFLPLTSALSSLSSDVPSLTSVTPNPMALTSTLVPPPSHSYPSSILPHSSSQHLQPLLSNLSTSGYPLSLETYSLHAPISLLSNSSSNNSLRSPGLHQITSVIATPSLQYSGGNSRRLTMSAYASVSSVSALLGREAAETSLNSPMQDSLLSVSAVPLGSLSLESPTPLMHETASLLLASASLVLSSSQHDTSYLPQMEIISMSSFLTLPSTIAPTSFPHPFSAPLHASLNSDFSLNKQPSFGLVTPVFPGSSNDILSSHVNVENHLSLSMLTTILPHSNSALIQRITSAPVILETASSPVFMSLLSGNAHLQTASQSVTGSSVFHNAPKEDKAVSLSIHPSSLSQHELSSIASSKYNLHSSSFPGNTSSSLTLSSLSSSLSSYVSLANSTDLSSLSSFNEMLMSSMSLSFTLSLQKSHQPHPSSTNVLDGITSVTSSPLSFLLPVGPVTMSSSLPSPPPSILSESKVAMTTGMLTLASTSWSNHSIQNTTPVFSSLMSSPTASGALSSMASILPSAMSELGMNFSVDSVDASALLETLLLTQTSYQYVTLSDINTNSDSLHLSTTDLQSSEMTLPTTLFYTSLTPSFVTSISKASSLVPPEPSLSTITQLDHLSSVYRPDTLITASYYIETITVSDMLTQFSEVSNYDSVTPVTSNSFTLKPVELDSTHHERLSLTPTSAASIMQTQIPYTSSIPIYETLTPTQTFAQSTPLSQVLIQTPTPSLSSNTIQASTLLSSDRMQTMPTILASPSFSDTASMQMTLTSSLLYSTLYLTSMITENASISSGVTIASMPLDVSVDITSSSSSVSMPDVSIIDSVDNLSSADGNVTSTPMPLLTGTPSQVQPQTPAPSSSFLSSLVSTELLNTSTEAVGTLYSSSLISRTASAVIETPNLSPSVQSFMSSVQTNESISSSSSSSTSTFNLTSSSSSVQDVLPSTYAIMSSDTITQRDSMMPTMISSFVNSFFESTIMPSSSFQVPTESLIINSTMQSSFMHSMSEPVSNQTEAMLVQSSTVIVRSELASTTIISSVPMLHTSSAGQIMAASSVVTESAPVNPQNISLTPTGSLSSSDSVLSNVVPMTTKTSSSLSSSQMVLQTPNVSTSSDIQGTSSRTPTPSLPIIPTSSTSPLPPNSTLYAGASTIPGNSSTAHVISILQSPSLSLVPTSLIETQMMNSTSSTPVVSVEILSTPVASLGTLSPSLSVSMSSVFVPTTPATQVNLSSIDPTPVVVSVATTSFSTEISTSAISTTSVTLPASTPAADNSRASPASSSAVVPQETSSSTSAMFPSASLNQTMTSVPTSDVTSSVALPGTSATPTTFVTTPMTTTEATTTKVAAFPTTSTAPTTPTTTSEATTTPPVVTTSQEITNASTVSRTTQTMTLTPFDTSFATRPYWLTMGLVIDEDIDIKAPSYFEQMEGNLARMYLEANRRSNQRMVEVEELLEQLDPEKNPAIGLTGRRRRRAVTVETITAQIIDMTRQTDPTNVELTFYIVEEGTKLLSGDARMVLNELTLQEMTLFLGEPVNSPPIEVIPSTTVMPSSGPPARLWIIAAVLVPLAFMFFCCLCCCCCCCGRKPRKEDGPMDPDTFKMLQFKAKYPYRQYPASPQDQQLQPVPRGFDVAKQDYANNAFGMEAGTLERKQQIVEEAEMMIQRELPKRSGEGHVSPVMHSARHQYPVAQSPTPSGSSSSSLVPPLPVKQTTVHQRSRDASTSGSDTGEELYKQRREYMAAQEEISRVLEPELYSSQGRKSQKGKASGKKGGVQKMKERKADGDKAVKNKLKKMESLPDNHYARAGVGAQDEADNRPEPLQETKQKMHALIDEAFSLVGKTSPSKNAVVPFTGGLSDSQNYNSREEGRQIPRDSSQQEVPRQLFAPVLPPISKKKLKDGLIDGGTQTSEMGQTTRVVVVPVTKPPQEGSGIIWSPYTAGDETARLNSSQEPASLPGGINPSPIPSPRGLAANHHQGLSSPRERRPDGDSLRGTKQGVVERYADMLQEMLTSQLPLPPEEDDGIPSKSTHNRSIALLEGEPDYDWSFDRSINGSQKMASKKRSPLPDRTRPNRTEKDSASGSKDEKMPSLGNKEKGLGKAVDKFYDELDVSTNLKYPTGQYSPQVANAVREELIRLTRRMGDGEESGMV